ncbi:MAG: DNA polymerase III subunit delta [Clostridiales bacterium]|nr:DNA polymerase III subunit delta [Candidatus Equinaster intestinalis]
MAVLGYSEFKNKIKGEITANVYFIFGNDAYLKKQCVSKIIDKTVERDDIFNFLEFGENVTMRELMEAAEQFPLMRDKKCILLTDYDIEKIDKSTLDTLLSIIENLPDTTVFVIWCNNIEFEYKKCDKAKKIAAAVEKRGGFAAQIDHLSPIELRKMLIAGAQKRGKTLRNSDADYLIENCSEDINILKNELEKLCGYAENEITREMIDKVTVRSIEASVYELSKRIFALNTSAAMQLLDELFYLKTEPIIILHNIFTAFIDTYRVYTGDMSGKTLSVIASDFGYGKREFVLSKMKGNAAKMTDKKFSLCFEEIINADINLKSFSSSQRTVIEELTVRLIYILSKGEKIDKAE